MLQKGKQLSSMQKDIFKLTQTRTSVERRETPLTRVVIFRLSRVSRTKEREDARDLISTVSIVHYPLKV